MTNRDAPRSSSPPTRIRPAALPSMRLVAAVAVGGAVGTAARHLVGVWFPVDGHALPWATLTINVSGALLLGVARTAFTERLPQSRHRSALVCTGVLGAYTTFATVSVEAATLLRQGRGLLAGAYVAGSLVLGSAAVVTGVALARRPQRRMGRR